MGNYDLVFDFLTSRTQQLTEISYQDWDDSYYLKLKHPNVLDVSSWNSNLHFLSVYGDSTLFDVGKKAKLVNDTLVVSIADKTKTYPDNWVLKVENAKPNQIHSSLVQYLQTDRDSLDQFIEALKKLDTQSKIKVRKDSLVVGYRNQELETEYKIVRINKDLTSAELNTKHLLIGKINQNTFWLRRQK